MKAKLSLLALPLCLGLVITFVLAACSSGSTNNSDPGTSSGSNNNYLSSNVKPDDGTLEIKGLSIDISGEKVNISGRIEATLAEPILKVEVLGVQPDRIFYNNEEGANPKTYSPGVKTVVLDIEIDLTKTSIECGKDIGVTLKACIDAACGNNKFATESGTFRKPDYMCGISSAGGAGVSSSSEASWVFGEPQFADVPVNTSITIGSGSFKLTGDDEIEAQPDITVSGGTIRRAMSIGSDDDVVPGKAYSSKDNNLGSAVPSASTEVVQNQEYYIIYLSDGSKYLLQFTKGGSSFASWPKKCEYWRATESP